MHSSFQALQRSHGIELSEIVARAVFPLSVLDLEGTQLFVNDAYCVLVSRTRAALTGTSMTDLCHSPLDVEVVEAALAAARSGGPGGVVACDLLASPDVVRPVQLTWTSMTQPTGEPWYVVAALHDETQSEARFRTIVETAHEGIWAVRADGRTLFANARMAEILGKPLERVYAADAAALLGRPDRERVTRVLEGRAARGPEQYEIGYPHPDGEHRRLLIAASPLPGPDGTPIGSLAMVSDVTEARLVERELTRAALHDALTGLPNRALLQDRLEQALLRHDGRTAVVFLDLDRFKLVNDARGHAIGDELLKEVGRRLTASVRPQDTVARFGGDEFVVLAEELDEGAAQRLAQHLLDALTPPVTLHGTEFHLEASAGVALSPPSSAADLLRHADAAMSAGKAAGRGRVRCYDPARGDEREQQYVLSSRLRRVLEDDGLTMEYQPILDLTSGQVLGMEALARWHDPDYGEVPPERFLALAALNGQAPALDHWAVRRALEDAGVLRRSGAIRTDAYVSVNLTANHLADAGLEELLVTTTAASGLEPPNVMLEITEDAVMEEADLAIAVLRRLRVRGFALALDDFGTGHSSLAYLRDLPMTVLKIDRSFVAGLRADTDALAIVSSVVALGRTVGMTVIAEGVETQEQADLLRDLGCQAGQGWLWSRALPVAEILDGQRWATAYDVGRPGAVEQPRRRAARVAVGPEHGLERILTMHRRGASLSTIAAALNLDGYLTPTGRRWHQTSVARAVSDTAHPLTATPSRR